MDRAVPVAQDRQHQASMRGKRCVLHVTAHAANNVTRLRRLRPQTPAPDRKKACVFGERERLLSHTMSSRSGDRRPRAPQLAAAQFILDPEYGTVGDSVLG